MLKSFVNKIHVKLHPYRWGCSCCMQKSANFKPFLRRQTRRKLKRMLHKDNE
jgi:hypothetical protein